MTAQQKDSMKLILF